MSHINYYNPNDVKVASSKFPSGSAIPTADFFKAVQAVADDPFKQQVGGDHYKTMKIQPIEYILANDLGFCEANIVKYISRYKQKNGVQDVKKVIHYAEMLLAHLEEQANGLT